MGEMLSCRWFGEAMLRYHVVVITRVNSSAERRYDGAANCWASVMQDATCGVLVCGPPTASYGHRYCGCLLGPTGVSQWTGCHEKRAPALAVLLLLCCRGVLWFK